MIFIVINCPALVTLVYLHLSVQICYFEYVILFIFDFAKSQPIYLRGFYVNKNTKRVALTLVLLSKGIFSEWSKLTSYTIFLISFLLGEFHGKSKNFGKQDLFTINKVFPTFFGKIWPKKIEIVCLRWNFVSAISAKYFAKSKKISKPGQDWKTLISPYVWILTVLARK